MSSLKTTLLYQLAFIALTVLPLACGSSTAIPDSDAIIGDGGTGYEGGAPLDDSGAAVPDSSKITVKIWGQPSLSETTPNRVSGNRLFYPQGVIVDRNATPNRVYVWDSGNQRILAFRSLGTCAGGTNANKACTNKLDCPSSTCTVDPHKKADMIIGQKDEFHANCNGDNTRRMPASAKSLCGLMYPNVISLLESPDPNGHATDSKHNLYVFDKWNHRVLRYDDPLNTDATADKVWGQADFKQRDCNRGTGDAKRDKTTLCGESRTGNHIGGDGAGGGVAIDAQDNLWVVDNGNYRVLRFPKGANEPDLVLGQKDFTTKSVTACQAGDGSLPPDNTFCNPNSISVSPHTGEMFMVDWPSGVDLFRILIFKPPFSNGMSATTVLAGSTNGKYPLKLNRPSGIQVDPFVADAFWLQDANHHRLLFFKKSGNAWTPKTALPQPNLTRTDCGGLEAQCTTPDPPYYCHMCFSAGGIGIDSAGNIYASNTHLNHILRFEPPFTDTPLTGGTPTAAKTIFLQAKYEVGTTVNAISATDGFSFRALLLSDYPATTQLIVVDQFRILYWNNFRDKPSGAAADGVLLQDGFDTQIHNGPHGEPLSLDRDQQGRVLVGTSNGTVLIYKGPLTHRAEPIDTIPNEIQLRKGGKLKMGVITGVAFDKGSGDLWLADTQNHRVVRISSPFDADNRRITMVLGQPNATSTEANRGKDIAAKHSCLTIVPDGFGNISHIRLDRKGNLYVADTSHEGWQCSNNRIVQYDKDTITIDPLTDFFGDGERTPHRVYGASNFTSKDDLPPVSPQFPISMTFRKDNAMLVTVDAYGNEQDERIFFYKDPLPSCNAPCSVAHSTIAPVLTSQPFDAAWDDKTGGLVILDETWTRILYYPQPNQINIP